MKIFFSLIITLFLVTKGIAQDGRFRINGRWVSNPGARLLLWYLAPGQKSSHRDTIVVKKDGSFVFQGTVEEPLPALIRVISSEKGSAGTIPSLNFYLENSDIVVKVIDQLHEAKVEGSKTHANFAKLQEETRQYNKEITAAAREALSLQQNGSLTKEREEELLAINKIAAIKKNKILLDFIRDNPNSYVSIYALREYAGPFIKPETVEPVFNLLSAQMRSSLAAKQFAELLSNTKQIQIGYPAPSIKLDDFNGKYVDLDVFKNNYLLIDFWASWCVPCRAMNPEWVSIYQQFRSKGFEILGVSFDVNKKNWIEAIRKDKLSWPNVSELLPMENSPVAKRYGIVAVPQNVLLDRDGKVMARNITPDKLDALLKDLLR